MYIIWAYWRKENRNDVIQVKDLGISIQTLAERFVGIAEYPDFILAINGDSVIRFNLGTDYVESKTLVTAKKFRGKYQEFYHKYAHSSDDINLMQKFKRFAEQELPKIREALSY